MELDLSYRAQIFVDLRFSFKIGENMFGMKRIGENEPNELILVFKSRAVRIGYKSVWTRAHLVLRDSLR
jgi:hypothetical protein